MAVKDHFGLWVPRGMSSKFERKGKCLTDRRDQWERPRRRLQRAVRVGIFQNFCTSPTLHSPSKVQDNSREKNLLILHAFDAPVFFATRCCCASFRGVNDPGWYFKPQFAVLLKITASSLVMSESVMLGICRAVSCRVMILDYAQGKSLEW